jgi:1,4-alpha-glucan branching enzyme
MSELVKNYPDAQGLTRRALNQALRELLLAQSSDWGFILGTGTHTSYAVKRTKDHLLRFNQIYEDIKCASIDDRWLADIEHKDNLFPNIDYQVHR